MRHVLPDCACCGGTGFAIYGEEGRTFAKPCPDCRTGLDIIAGRQRLEERDAEKREKRGKVKEFKPLGEKQPAGWD